MTDKNYFNEDYEKVILGILLLDNTLIDIISGRLTRECFYNSKNAFIFNAICEQWKTDKCVNLVTLSAEYAALDASFLASLTDTVASVQNWEFYVSKIKELYLARSFKNELGHSLQSLDPNDINNSISNLQTKLTSFMQYGGNTGAEVKNLCVEIPEEIMAASKSTAKYLGYESGFEQLDDILDGWQTSYMYVVGARPSIGKTAFALALLRKLCQHGASATMFSLEMSAKQCFYRMLSSEANLPMWQLKKGICMQYQNGVTKLKGGLTKLYDYNLNIIDVDASAEESLYSRIRYEALVKGKKVFVVDHLGLVQSSHPTAQHYLDVGRITSKLHQMAKELDICIILLCQMNREAEGKKPNMSLIRESGNIEQDADVIMFLYRERDSKETCIPTDVIVEKNRDGKIGTANFIFNTETQNFVENNGDSHKDYEAPVIPVKKENHQKYEEDKIPEEEGLF